MRICIDLDGTIAKNKVGDQTYEDVEPMENAAEVLNELRDQGFYIIIHTARNMGTCDNNLGRVIARQANLVTGWLEKYKIPYDELLFGKPNVDYFIDDKGVGFEDWTKTKNFLMGKIDHV